MPKHPHHISFGTIRGTVIEWLGHSDPLTRPQLTHQFTTFANTVGEPATIETESKTVTNEHMRTTSADMIRSYATANNIALVQTTHQVEYAEIFGYPQDKGITWVPLILAVPGPPEHTREIIQNTLSTIQNITDKHLRI